MNRRRFLISSSAILAAPAVLRAQGAPHIVGTLFPLSGFNAEFGQMYQNGVQLALDHLNEDKVLKSAVEVRSVDSQGTPQGGAVGMTRLANVDKASYVMIGFTGVSKAAAPIGQRAKVVMVNGGGVGPDLASLSDYFWNVIPLADREVRAVLPWIKSKNFKRVAMIYSDDPSGLALLSELKRGLPEIGAAMVGNYSVPFGTTQFGAIAAQVRDTNPDAIYFASVSGPQAVQIIKQLRDNGLTQQIITYSTGNLPSVSALPEAEGLVFTGQAADWSSTEPLMNRFVTGWRKKVGGEPTIYALNYYNAMLLFGQLAKGLEAAGQPVTGETLLAERRRVKRFALAGGVTTFAEDGTAEAPVQVSQVRGGRTEKLL